MHTEQRIGRLSAGSLLDTRLVAVVLGILLTVGAAVVLATTSLQTINIVVSFALALLALVLAYYSSAACRLVNPAFLFVCTYVVLVFVGTVIAYARAGESDPVMIGAGLLFFSLGAYSVGSHWVPRMTSIVLMSPSRSRAMLGKTSRWIISVGLLAVGVLGLLAYRRVGIPLLSSDINQTFASFTSATPRYTNVVLYDLPMILIVVSLVQVINVRSRSWISITGVLILLFSALIVASSRRYPIFYMSIASAIVIGHYRIGRWFRPRNIALAAVAVALVLSAFFVVGVERSATAQLVISQQGYTAGLAYLVYNRFLYSQAHVVGVIFQYFPGTYNYLGGYTFADQFLRWPWTSPQFSFARFLYPLLGGPVSIPGSLVGFAPPTMLGEFYANYGTSLTMLLMAAWGAVAGLFERVMARRIAESPVYLVTYSMLAMFLVVSCTEGLYETFHSFVYTTALVFIFVWLVPKVISPLESTPRIPGKPARPILP